MCCSLTSFNKEPFTEGLCAFALEAVDPHQSLPVRSGHGATAPVSLFNSPWSSLSVVCAETQTHLIVKCFIF